jgi:hypothetical protein
MSRAIVAYNYHVPTSTGSGSFFSQPVRSVAAEKSYPSSSMVTSPDEFTEYEDYNFSGWDGMKAQAISAETVQGARSFALLLPREQRPADIAPGADGTIGFEWRTGSTDHRVITLVDIGPGDRVIARRLFSSGQTVEYGVTTVRTGAAALIMQLF